MCGVTTMGDSSSTNKLKKKGDYEIIWILVGLALFWTIVIAAVLYATT